MEVIARRNRRGSHETRHSPARVIHGAGSVEELGAEIDRLRSERPYLVTTRSLVREGNLLSSVEKAIGDRVVGTFGESDAHAPRPTVLTAARAAAAAGADCLVAFGGGSVTDTCRGMQIALAEDLQSPEEFDAYKVQFGPFVGTP